MIARPRARDGRLAAAVFYAYEGGSMVWLVAQGRSLWFINDEWDFLAGRTAFDLHDLFRPHNEHLSVLPILAFRLLWWLVGMKSYVPYLALLVVLHLTAAALLRLVMRRAGVGPWISTLTASILVLFGSGAFNIEFAFQIGFVGALVLGLGALLLTDHDGAIDRRDVLALGCALAAVLSSGVGVTMVIVVFVSTLLRRGWRVAAVHAAVPAVLYVTWFAVIGRSGYDQRRASFHEALSFVWANARGIFQSIGVFSGADIALAVMLVAGLYLAWTRLGTERARAQLSAVAGLLVGAIAFLVSTSIGRGHLPQAVGIFAAGQVEPQVVYIAAALVLPPLAVAAAEIIRRRQWLAPVVCILLVVGMPRNVDRLVGKTQANQTIEREFRRAMLSIPQLEVAGELPRSYRPSLFAPEVTMGWLLDGVASGRIPKVARLSAVADATLTLQIVLRSSSTQQVSNDCPALLKHQVMRLPKNGAIGIRTGSVAIVSITEQGVRSAPVTYSARLLSRSVLALTTVIPLTVDVAPVNGPSAEICTGAKT